MKVLTTSTGAPARETEAQPVRFAWLRNLAGIVFGSRREADLAERARGKAGGLDQTCDALASRGKLDPDKVANLLPSRVRELLPAHGARSAYDGLQAIAEGTARIEREGEAA